MGENLDKVYIVIPAHNEGKVIKKVVKQVIENGFWRVIVVDDGSTDNTSQEAKEADAITVRHKINRGKGAATITGIRTAIKCGADIIVTMDGDGQHAAADIGRLIAPIISKEAQIVLGTRLFNRGQIPWYKIAQNMLANAVTWMVAGIWVEDSQSGFRAYTSRALAKMDIRGDTYEFESEIIRSLAAAEISYKEVYIQAQYTKYSMSKLHKQDLINGAKTLYKLLWNVLTGIIF